MKTVCALLMLMGTAIGYPTGPPTKTKPGLCKDLTPQHGVQSQPLDKMPYEITTDNECFKENRIVKVSIRITSELYFEGFLVVANKPGINDTAYGTFAKDEDFQYADYTQSLSCFNKDNNAFGHKGERHQYGVSFKWTAPADLKKDIRFRATILKGKQQFWVGATKNLKYDANCADVSGAAHLESLFSVPVLLLAMAVLAL